MKLIRFYTGYLVNSCEINRSFNYKGKNFLINFIITNNSLNSHIKVNYSFNNKKISNVIKEVIILAKNEKDSHEISELIYSALVLLEASFPPFSNIPSEPITTDDYFTNSNKTNKHKHHYILHYSQIPFACEIACRASFKKSYKYSLLKYYLACNLHSNDIIDLDPSHSDYVDLKKYYIYDHIRIGYAIVIFYSIIEELGLEIRASNAMPSVIKNKWNPKVYNDLKIRLLKAKIDIHTPIPWNIRSTPTKIEKNKKPFNCIKSEWSNYNIRDSYLDIIDAIRIISWIRSKVISHKFDKSITSLSIYDVANANFLSRRLLLDIFNQFNI